MLCFAKLFLLLMKPLCISRECYPCVADLFTIESSKDHFENHIIAFHASDSPWTFILLSLSTWSQACLIYSSPRKFLFRDGLRRDHIVSEELQFLKSFLVIQLSIDSLENFCSCVFAFNVSCFVTVGEVHRGWSSFLHCCLSHLLLQFICVIT